VFAAGSDIGDVFVFGFVLIGVIGVLGRVVWLIRRRLLSAPPAEGEDSWSLQHLREMKVQGQITDDEFERLKSKLLEETRLSLGRNNGTTSVDGG
jgi:hypothetical protein